MLTKLRAVLFLTVVAGSLHLTFASAAEPENFTCAFPISEGQQSIRNFSLVAEVYQCFNYTGYADMVVVNAAQQRVPFRLVTPAAKSSREHYKKAISYYQEPAASGYKTGDQIRRIAQLTGLASGSESDQQWQAKNTYYSSLILELAKPRDALENISISTEINAQAVSATVVLEASDDLQHWKTLLSPRNLLFLPSGAGDAKQLLNNVLEVSENNPSRYLRFSVLSNVENFTHMITAITGEYSHLETLLPELQWYKVSAAKELTTDNEWIVPVPGLLPVSLIRISPAADIVFYQGAIYIEPHLNPVSASEQARYRDSDKHKLKQLIRDSVDKNRRADSAGEADWRYVSSFSSYRLQTESGITTSADLKMASTQSAQWKLKFNQPAVLNAAQLPELELGWQPPLVSFVAQGAGPFMLLVGNQERPQSLAFPAQLASLKDNPEMVSLLPKMTGISTGQDLAPGDNTAAPYNYKTVLLWVILLIGVGFMAAMAYRLAKNMKADS